MTDKRVKYNDFFFYNPETFYQTRPFYFDTVNTYPSMERDTLFLSPTESVEISDLTHLNPCCYFIFILSVDFDHVSGPGVHHIVYLVHSTHVTCFVHDFLSNPDVPALVYFGLACFIAPSTSMFSDIPDFEVYEIWKTHANNFFFNTYTVIFENNLKAWENSIYVNFDRPEYIFERSLQWTDEIGKVPYPRFAGSATRIYLSPLHCSVNSLVWAPYASWPSSRVSSKYTDTFHMFSKRTFFHSKYTWICCLSCNHCETIRSRLILVGRYGVKGRVALLSCPSGEFGKVEVLPS